MRLIRTSLVEAVEATRTRDDLCPYLQAAVELELATIPVYLTGLFTLRRTAPGEVNAGVAALLRSVVDEEMLHLTIAANTLAALGGRAEVNLPGAVPRYPGHLPHGTDDALVVRLGPISRAAILETYMRIEEPDLVLQPEGERIPLGPPSPAPAGAYASIGDFYRAIAARLAALPRSAFVLDPSRQIVGAFPGAPRLPLPVIDAASAAAAILLIVDQGEGTTLGPAELLAGSEPPPHFYRFAEVIMGRRIEAAGDGYAFTGAPLAFDPGEVLDMVPDPTLAEMERRLPPEGFAACASFSRLYSRLLDQLAAAFGGRPAALREGMALMSELGRQAARVLAIELDDGKRAGLCFELVRR